MSDLKWPILHCNFRFQGLTIWPVPRKRLRLNKVSSSSSSNISGDHKVRTPNSTWLGHIRKGEVLETPTKRELRRSFFANMKLLSHDIFLPIGSFVNYVRGSSKSPQTTERCLHPEFLFALFIQRLRYQARPTRTFRHNSASTRKAMSAEKNYNVQSKVKKSYFKPGPEHQELQHPV